MNSTFRVWDPHAEKMHLPPHRFNLNSEGAVFPEASMPDDDLVPLFYTGLDDAEGTPIYESDVVESIYDVRYEVFWDPAWGRFDVDRLGKGSGDWTHAVMSGLTVIGNRYETPELLD